MSTTTDNLVTWYGWARSRPGRPWRLVCKAGTDSACWAELLGKNLPGDKLVRQGSSDPNLDPRAK